MRETTLEAGLKSIFHEFLMDLNTCTVGEITAFDGKNKVSVQLGIKMRLEDGSEQLYPVLEGVPLFYPGGGGFRITFPVQQGDPVLVLFGQRDLERWKTQGSITSAASNRRFHLSDAIAIPGLDSFFAAPAVGDSLTIWNQNNAGRIEMASDGTVTINGNLEVLT